MSKREIFSSTTAKPVDLKTAMSMEAWLNPDFFDALAADKVAAVKRFALAHDYPPPSDEEAAELDLLPNPVGELLPAQRTTMDDPYTQSCPDPTDACTYNCTTICTTSYCASQFCTVDCPPPETYYCGTTLNGCGEPGGPPWP